MACCTTTRKRGQRESLGVENEQFTLSPFLHGYQTGTGNRLTSDGTWTYSYDDAGNLTKKTKGVNDETWTYTYDHRNELTRLEKRSTDGGTLVWQGDYRYDAFGNRIEQVTGPGIGPAVTTRFAYDGPHVWADLDGSNQLLTRRFYLDTVDDVFARIAADGTAAWYLTDHLGSIRDVTNATGAVQDHLNYDGFGNLLSESSPSFGDRYKWTGREYDSDSKLQYNRARYYATSLGRWITTDPLEFSAGDTNMYRYVLNRPVTHTDPSGTMASSSTGPDLGSGSGSGPPSPFDFGYPGRPLFRPIPAPGSGGTLPPPFGGMFGTPQFGKPPLIVPPDKPDPAFQLEPSIIPPEEWVLPGSRPPGQIGPIGPSDMIIRFFPPKITIPSTVPGWPIIEIEPYWPGILPEKWRPVLPPEVPWRPPPKR